MRTKTALFLLFLIGSVLISACTQSTGPSGYAAYNQPQQPYVGGGCGVAPSSSYEATIVDGISNPAL